MKQFFSDNYSKICLAPSREQLERRWQGIETYCKKEEVDVLELAKLYYLLKAPDTFKQEFVAIFHDIDISFDPTNTREIAYLAGNILINLMENANLALDIIFAIICLSEYKIDVVLPEVIEMAYKKFGKISADTRERVITYKNVNTKSIKDYAVSLKELEEFQKTQITGLAELSNNIASSLSILIQN